MFQRVVKADRFNNMECVSLLFLFEYAYYKLQANMSLTAWNLYYQTGDSLLTTCYIVLIPFQCERVFPTHIP